MSNLHLSLEEEISNLRREGYNITVIGGILIARDIPYVNTSRTIERGILAFPVELSSDGLMASGDHTVYFFGSEPCTALGAPLDIVANKDTDFNIPGIGRAKFRLSRKKALPANTSSGYINAKEKLETYISIIASHATRIDNTVTPKTGNIAPEIIISSPFLYPDTASMRVGISHLNTVFENQRIGIIGLGGTGSYILDLVAKTNVQEIHIFDDDLFRSHNAFRAPGAASQKEIETPELKVERFKRIYSVLRSGIIAHPRVISFDDAEELRDLTFVFLSVDTPSSHYDIGTLLMRLTIPFIDVGLCANVVQSPTTSLIATVRTTFWKEGIPSPFGDNNSNSTAQEDDYSSNIQIAELNALNATLAVIRWKKHLGYYQDWEGERISLYDSNVQSLKCL